VTDPADKHVRVALITGAGRRIGRTIALDLSRNGWHVAVHYAASRHEADAVVAEIRHAGGVAIPLGADLANAGDAELLIPRCADALGAPELLVNSAALFLDDRLETLDPDQWDRQQAVNLRAPVLLAKAFAAHLPLGRHGLIINIVDQRVWRLTPEFFSYTIAKAGLYTATRMLAQALAPRIRVNAIGPGPVLPSIHQTPDAFAEEVAATPLGRATPPEEIAAAVRFILDAPSMTGQMIALDAGQHLSRPEGQAAGGTD
jgi:NAD(P)-dependent dehydrogenase (short-subunit alcohol dehydrogenase family)